MSSTFSSLSASLIARQIARASRPRPWIVPAPVVKPAPVACSTAVPSSTLSSLPKSAIARVTARVCRSQTLSTVSSFASSKRSIVGGRQSPVFEAGRHQATLSARAAARASRDRPWLNPRSGSIAAKVSKSKSTTAQWIKSQAVDLRQAPRRLPQASRHPSSVSLRHVTTSDTSMSIPAPPMDIPKRRTATTGSRQAVRYPSTSNNRPAAPSSINRGAVRSSSSKRSAVPLSSVDCPAVPSRSLPSSRPQQVLTPASPDKSIAAIVREAFAFDINKFRAEVEPIYKKIESHRQWLRRLTRKRVAFDDNPTVIEHPRWIEKKEHVDFGPPSIMGHLLAWRRIDEADPYAHVLVWGSDSSNFDHCDCENPGCHRRAKDLYMDNYEEWTAPTFTTISD